MVDIFDGFAKIAALSKQWNPHIKQEVAFQMAFPNQPFAKSIYNKAMKSYLRNQDLEATFQTLGCSTMGDWKNFIIWSKELIAEATKLRGIWGLEEGIEKTENHKPPTQEMTTYTEEMENIKQMYP